MWLFAGGGERAGADAVHGTAQDGGGQEADSTRPRDTPRDARDRRRRGDGRSSQEPRARQDHQVAGAAVQQVGLTAGQHVPQSPWQPADGRRRRRRHRAPRLSTRRRNSDAALPRRWLCFSSWARGPSAHSPSDNPPRRGSSISTPGEGSGGQGSPKWAGYQKKIVGHTLKHAVFDIKSTYNH